MRLRQPAQLESAGMIPKALVRRLSPVQSPAKHVVDVIQAHLIVCELLENSDVSIETRVHLKNLLFRLEDEINALRE